MHIRRTPHAHFPVFRNSSHVGIAILLSSPGSHDTCARLNIDDLETIAVKVRHETSQRKRVGAGMLGALVDLRKRRPGAEHATGNARRGAPPGAVACGGARLLPQVVADLFRQHHHTQISVCVACATRDHHNACLQGVPMELLDPQRPRNLHADVDVICLAPDTSVDEHLAFRQHVWTSAVDDHVCAFNHIDDRNDIVETRGQHRHIRPLRASEQPVAHLNHFGH
mmetsp:Transcript_50662/g.147394  ORF Transcript_50662/g.147394 Transcript_50662/m.147394 type:complete len:225 (-) Transcript_50662:395-1069(-)